MKKLLKYILKYWKEHKWRISILIVFSIISTIIMVYWPVILKNVIDSITENLKLNNVLKNLFIFVILSFLFVFFYTSIQLNRIFINRSFFFKMTLDLVIFILKQSKKFFNKFKTGDILTRIIDDIQNLSWFSCSGIFRFFDALSIIIFSFVVMISLSPQITLFILIPIILIFINIVLIEKKLDYAYEQLQKSISEVNDNIEKAFSAIKIIKSCNMEEFSSKEFELLMNKRKNKELRIVLLDAIWHGSNMFYMNLGFFIIILFSGKFVIAGTLSLGTFIAFTQYYYTINEYFYSIVYFFVNLKRNTIASKRIMELYENDSILKYDKIFYEGYKSLINIENIEKIEFKNVTLKFGDRTIFENLNLTINKGDFIGIKGKVGSGKTLLCDLIVGNEMPSSGEILVNGIPIEKINIKSYRANFGYVLQEPLLFSESIKENITFSNFNSRKLDNLNFSNIEDSFYYEYEKRKFFDFFKKIDREIKIDEDEELKKREELNKDQNYKMIQEFNKNEDIKEIFNYKKLEKVQIDEFKENEKYNLNYLIKIDENLIESINFANLTDDIKMFPDGINTKVGTKGIMVSGGQRERITIARAIYKKPNIYIFDDSTRSLDAKTEHKVIKNIKALSKNNTIIMVTHRIESLKYADKIIELG
ncbi:MAG: ABC transporter ATP-binding protein/permease [Spirochaetes bacterium]|nr:ABC transporter ATP-binding protein/permease [Spirochaetota bacterium]